MSNSNDDLKDERIESLEIELNFLKKELKKYEERQELFNSRIIRYAEKGVKTSIFVRTFRNRAIAFRNRAIAKLRREYNKYTPNKIKAVLSKIYSILFVNKATYINEVLKDTAKPIISVVVPFYNSATTIKDTVSSVLAQTLQDFELIIVDDGSDKEHRKTLDSIKDPRVKVYHLTENIGKGSPAAARNYGIERSKGRYVMCLDSDDMIKPTYLEKGVITLETKPWLTVFSARTIAFGVVNDLWKYREYDPRELPFNNMIITAAIYRKQAWQNVGGYTTDIGYEDWEFWIKLAEHGHFAFIIEEPLFIYRTAEVSRFIEDNKNHDNNIHKIRVLHPEYSKIVKKSWKKFRRLNHGLNTDTAFINLKKLSMYPKPNGNDEVLVAMSWMAFGGAETLILNFTKELASNYNITFVTGLKDEHVWQKRFEEISENIYHLANIFSDKDLYIEFISNYILTRNVKILHILHTDFLHEHLYELKSRHPKLKIIVTMFNSRVDHFPKIYDVKDSIDAFTSDNSSVVQEYKKFNIEDRRMQIIPNGIDSSGVFNPNSYDSEKLRNKLGIQKDDIAVFFIGRLSQEKNPDVFVDVANYFDSTSDYGKLKFFVVGDGPMRNQLEKSIKDSSNIQYLGYRSDIAEMLSVADVFVLPSSIEGFPLSILEAMAMDTVCISSAVGAVPDVLHDGVDGFVVTPGSKNEIVDSLIVLINSPDKLSKMQQQSRATVTKLYSSELLGKNYKKLYKDVTKG